MISALEALEMATIRGARAIHQDKEIGSLEAGKRADVIIVGMDSIHQTPLYNVYSQLVYATKASDVLGDHQRPSCDGESACAYYR